MSSFIIGGVMLLVTVLCAYAAPRLPEAWNAPAAVPAVAALTGFVIWYLYSADGRRRRRVDELNSLMLHEERRTAARYLIHESKNIIQNVGIQTELLSRATTLGEVSVIGNTIKKILAEENAKLDKASLFYKKDGSGNKKASKAILKAVSDASLFASKDKISLNFHTQKKDMKCDYEKLHSAVFFALMNGFSSLGRNERLNVNVTERTLGYTDFLEIAVDGGTKAFDKTAEDLFSPFNAPSSRHRDFFGLASVRRLATDMGGFSEVEVNADKTMLYIVIPVVK
jgi:hypothetical protein